jgi:uncharacterized DUF497 family protein
VKSQRAYAEHALHAFAEWPIPRLAGKPSFLRDTTRRNRSKPSDTLRPGIATIMLWAISSLLIDDPDHSEYEDRLLLLGYSLQARCLVVGHCYRQSDSVIRLISARRATGQEQEVYWRLR